MEKHDFGGCFNLNIQMKIITNADDFGYDEDSVNATIECFNKGSITSATIMPNMPGTHSALKFARMNPHFSFGVHLTFVSNGIEMPISDVLLIPRLVKKNGTFLGSNKLRMNAILGFLPVEQIEIEIAAQIERVLDSGVNISHIDSHGHIHKFNPFIQALVKILPKYGISRVRNVQNIYCNKRLLSPTGLIGPIWRRNIMNNFLTTNHFFMNTNFQNLNWVESILDRKLCGTLEVGFHPGSISHQEKWREYESRACNYFFELAMQKHIKFVGWKDIKKNIGSKLC